MTTALEGGEGSASRPAALYSRESTGTNCRGSWLGPRAGLDRYEKSPPPPGVDPQTVQAVASRYTDYATRSTVHSVNGENFPENKVTVRGADQFPLSSKLVKPYPANVENIVNS
jgi:hypothetical protein